MRYRVTLLLFSMICLISSGCSQSGSSAEKTDYEATKKMVVDILKTDDGKKAIQEVLSEDSVKSELVMEQDVITKAVESTITSDKGKKFWKEAFKDPKFAASYAKALKDEHKKLLKELSKDPDYRSMLMDIAKEPKIQTELTDLLKSKDIRKVYKETIIETLESPLVKAKIEDMILKAASQAASKEKATEEKKASK